MGKINVYGLKRPSRTTLTRTFATANGPMSLTFQRMTTVDFSRAFERAEELIATYITGDEEKGTEPEPFFPVGDEAAEVTDSLCRTAAQFELAQPEAVAERYIAEEFLAMANGLAPETWLEIRRFFGEANKGQSQGNASGAVMDTNSELPTDKTESDTPS